MNFPLGFGTLVAGLAIVVEICLPLKGVEETASLGGLFCEGKVGGGTEKEGKVGELLCEDKVGGGTTKASWLATLYIGRMD